MNLTTWAILATIAGTIARRQSGSVTWLLVALVLCGWAAIVKVLS